MNISREWYLELRKEMAVAWRKRFGNVLPAGSTPAGWIRSELDRKGVRLRGEEAETLPYALYMKVRIAGGTSKTGPEGPWKTLESILPKKKGKPGFLSRFFGQSKEKT